MKTQFSTRDLLLATAFVAAILGFLLWLVRLQNIDPESETVIVDGKRAVLRWESVKWQANQDTISHSGDGYLPISSESGSDGRLHLEQELFRLSYANYRGYPAFDAVLDVDGDRSRGQKHFPLRALVTGGGIMDGSVEVTLDFNDTDKVLTMKLTQQIHSKRIAKQATLQFRFDGERFRAVDVSNDLSYEID